MSTLSPTVPTSGPTISPTTVTVGSLPIQWLVIVYIILSICMIQFFVCLARVKTNQKLHDIIKDNLVLEYKELEKRLLALNALKASGGGKKEDVEKEEQALVTAFSRMSRRVQHLRTGQSTLSELAQGFYLPATNNGLAKGIETVMFHTGTGRTLVKAQLEIDSSIRGVLVYTLSLRLNAFITELMGVSGIDANGEAAALGVVFAIYISHLLSSLTTDQYLTNKMGGDTGVIEPVDVNKMVEEQMEEYDQSDEEG